MSELILTQEEKDTETFLEHSDESLGKQVRHVAHLLKDFDGKDGIYMISAAHLMIQASRDANSTETKLTMEGCTNKGVDTGDWLITIERTRKPEPQTKDQAG